MLKINVLEQAVEILFREVKVPKFGQAKGLLYLQVGRAARRVVDVGVVPRGGDVVVTDEANQLRRGKLVLERLPFDEPENCKSKVADEEMAVYAFLLLEEHRPCLKVCLHDAEAFLYPP